MTSREKIESLCRFKKINFSRDILEGVEACAEEIVLSITYLMKSHAVYCEIHLNNMEIKLLGLTKSDHVRRQVVDPSSAV